MRRVGECTAGADGGRDEYRVFNGMPGRKVPPNSLQDASTEVTSRLPLAMVGVVAGFSRAGLL